jgi:hypothetical protein
MEEASVQTHSSLEPMYSTIDPMLPTYREYVSPQVESESKTYVIKDGHYVEAPSSSQTAPQKWMDWATERFTAVTSGSGRKAKEFLKQESRQHALAKKAFLPDKRTSMITSDEIAKFWADLLNTLSP